MNYGILNPPLLPAKEGRAWQVLLVHRVSSPGPGKQDIRSLDDQNAADTAWLNHHLGAGRYQTTIIAGSGSGESLDRDDYSRVVQEIESGRYDLVLTEDLGRIVRRIHAHLICELCEDTDTRLMARHDHVDTAQPGWREASIFAAFHHERSNRDTSDRIKRTLRSRFMQGGCLRPLLYGWIKPLGAKSDLEVVKVPEAVPIYEEWFRRLDEDNASFADITRWLKTTGTKPPPSRHGDRGWNPVIVAQHTFNPMLKGVRERNRRKTKRVNATGRYISEKAPPEELLQRAVPHLAFFEADYYDRVVGKVMARNAHFRYRKKASKPPAGMRRPTRESRYPGRVTFCGICGRPFLWGGHGQTDHLVCQGVREYRCWNAATFDGPAAARALMKIVLDEAQGLTGFDAEFVAAVESEAARLDSQSNRRRDELTDQLAAIEVMIRNVMKFIKDGNDGESVRTEYRSLEAQKKNITGELQYLANKPSEAVQIPPVDELRTMLIGAMAEVDISSPEFGQIMRRLVPRMVVFPHRLLDGGLVVLRGSVRLQLANILPDRRSAEALAPQLERAITVDLFEPPQREIFRMQVLALRQQGLTEAAAAKKCGITITAAQRGAALQRRMDAMGIIDPYLPITEPSTDCVRFSRHLSDEYKFEPLPDSGA